MSNRTPDAGAAAGLMILGVAMTVVAAPILYLSRKFKVVSR